MTIKFLSTRSNPRQWEPQWPEDGTESVPNAAPTISVVLTSEDTSTPQLPVINEVVRFTADTFDPDGDRVDVTWLLESQPIGSTVTLANISSLVRDLTPDVAGTYKVKATATDHPEDHGSTQIPGTSSFTWTIFASAEPSDVTFKIGVEIGGDSAGVTDTNDLIGRIDDWDNWLFSGQGFTRWNRRNCKYGARETNWDWTGDPNSGAVPAVPATYRQGLWQNDPDKPRNVILRPNGPLFYHQTGATDWFDTSFFSDQYVDRNVSVTSVSGNNLNTSVAHDLQPLQRVEVTASSDTGLLPLGIYWTKTIVDSDTFTLSQTEDGSVFVIGGTLTATVKIHLYNNKYATFARKGWKLLADGPCAVSQEMADHLGVAYDATGVGNVTPYLNHSLDEVINGMIRTLHRFECIGVEGIQTAYNIFHEWHGIWFMWQAAAHSEKALAAYERAWKVAEFVQDELEIPADLRLKFCWSYEIEKLTNAYGRHYATENGHTAGDAVNYEEEMWPSNPNMVDYIVSDNHGGPRESSVDFTASDAGEERLLAQIEFMELKGKPGMVCEWSAKPGPVGGDPDDDVVLDSAADGHMIDWIRRMASLMSQGNFETAIFFEMITSDGIVRLKPPDTVHPLSSTEFKDIFGLNPPANPAPVTVNMSQTVGSFRHYQKDMCSVQRPKGLVDKSNDALAGITRKRTLSNLRGYAVADKLTRTSTAVNTTTNTITTNVNHLFIEGQQTWVTSSSVGGVPSRSNPYFAKPVPSQTFSITSVSGNNVNLSGTPSPALVVNQKVIITNSSNTIALPNRGYLVASVVDGDTITLRTTTNGATFTIGTNVTGTLEVFTTTLGFSEYPGGPLIDMTSSGSMTVQGYQYGFDDVGINMNRFWMQDAMLSEMKGQNIIPLCTTDGLPTWLLSSTDLNRVGTAKPAPQTGTWTLNEVAEHPTEGPAKPGDADLATKYGKLVDLYVDWILHVKVMYPAAYQFESFNEPDVNAGLGNKFESKMRMFYAIADAVTRARTILALDPTYGSASNPAIRLMGPTFKSLWSTSWFPSQPQNQTTVQIENFMLHVKGRRAGTLSAPFAGPPTPTPHDDWSHHTYSDHANKPQEIKRQIDLLDALMVEHDYVIPKHITETNWNGVGVDRTVPSKEELARMATGAIANYFWWDVAGVDSAWYFTWKDYNDHSRSVEGPTSVLTAGSPGIVGGDADGIVFPMFNLVRMMTDMYTTRVQVTHTAAANGINNTDGKGIGGFATKASDNSELRIIVWNWAGSSLTNGIQRSMQVDLTGLPLSWAGRQIRVQRQLIDSTHSNWKAANENVSGATAALQSVSDIFLPSTSRRIDLGNNWNCVWLLKVTVV